MSPEHNVTGIDFAQRGHLRNDAAPLIDFHAHVMCVRPTEQPEELPPDVAQAEQMLSVAEEFGIGCTVSMCPPEDITPFGERFGKRMEFNGSIAKKTIDEPDDAPQRLLDHFLELGVRLIKFWAAPRGRDRGLFVDAPWRIEAARRAQAAGIRTIMVHVGDPDQWFRTTYANSTKFGTKADQYVGLRRLMEMFPDMRFIGAHMGGDPEHPDHLEALLEQYPHLSFDTSATKWQVREVSPRGEAIRALICRHPKRFLFGSDLVTRPGLPHEHYVSRYWCQRTLWESRWQGPSPISDPDYDPGAEGPSTPILRGLDLPPDVLRRVYHDNAAALLK